MNPELDRCTSTLTVVLDGRFSRFGADRLRGESQLTPGLRELIEARKDTVEVWSRPWTGSPGHDIDLPGRFELRHLPDWRRAEIIRRFPVLLRWAKTDAPRGGTLLSIGPSFSQLALLLGGKLPKRSVQPSDGRIYLVRSHPSASLLLASEASNLLLRAFFRVFALVWTRLIRRANNVVVVSKALADELRIPQAVIAPEVGWAELRNAAGLREREDRHVLFVGRLEPEKGPDIALAAFMALNAKRESRLSIVGTGSMENSLRAAASSAAGVAFLGAQSRESVLDLMRSASVVLVPSRAEAFGLAALEAAVCGSRVLHSGIGGLDEACGWWSGSHRISSLDAESWATELETAVSSPPILERPPSVERLISSQGWHSLDEIVGKVDVARA